jgi:hypothetical protein
MWRQTYVKNILRKVGTLYILQANLLFYFCMSAELDLPY